MSPRATRVRANHLSTLPTCAAPDSGSKVRQVTGHQRRHAIRLLNSPAPGAARPPKPQEIQFAWDQPYERDDDAGIAVTSQMAR
jgi:hypothetical protein